jgi:hypothetical protein
MRTISSHVDEATAQHLTETAKLEDRKPSQITAAALRWYLRLPPSARDAMRRFEAAGEKAVDEAAWAVGRALLDKQYLELSRELSRVLPTELPADATEEQIMAEAVRLTRRK